jgi:hypothetical protein
MHVPNCPDVAEGEDLQALVRVEEKPASESPADPPGEEEGPRAEAIERGGPSQMRQMGMDQNPVRLGVGPPLRH